MDDTSINCSSERLRVFDIRRDRALVSAMQTLPRAGPAASQ